MISNFFLNIFYAIVAGIANQFPVATLSSETTTAITNISIFLSNINGLFPVTTLLVIIGIILGIEAVIITYKLVMWAIRKIPGIG